MALALWSRIAQRLGIQKAQEPQESDVSPKVPRRDLEAESREQYNRLEQLPTFGFRTDSIEDTYERALQLLKMTKTLREFKVLGLCPYCGKRVAKHVFTAELKDRRITYTIYFCEPCQARFETDIDTYIFTDWDDKDWENW